MGTATKNLMIGAAVLLCIGVAGYGYLEHMAGWGWWLLIALGAALILQ